MFAVLKQNLNLVFIRTVGNVDVLTVFGLEGTFLQFNVAGVFDFRRVISRRDNKAGLAALNSDSEFSCGAVAVNCGDWNVSEVVANFNRSLVNSNRRGIGVNVAGGKVIIIFGRLAEHAVTLSGIVRVVDEDELITNSKRVIVDGEIFGDSHNRRPVVVVNEFGYSVGDAFLVIAGRPNFAGGIHNANRRDFVGIAANGEGRANRHIAQVYLAIAVNVNS